MKNSMWFLLAAVVSLHGVAFAEEEVADNDSSSTEVVSQEREESTSLEQSSECK